MNGFSNLERSRSKPGLVWVTCGVLLLAAPGCYTTSNVVTVTPLATPFPVSASGQYVDHDGEIVDQDQYETVTPFQMERTFEVPRHGEGEARLELESDLQRIVAKARGDAVTDLKIEAVEYDPGSHGSAAGWKIFGFSMVVTGGTFLATGAAIGGDVGGLFYPFGGICAGIGVVSLLLSATTNDPAKWQFQVSGQVVRRKDAHPDTGAASPEEL